MRSRASHDFFHPRWGVIGEDAHLAAVKGVANLQILDEYFLLLSMSTCSKYKTGDSLMLRENFK